VLLRTGPADREMQVTPSHRATGIIAALVVAGGYALLGTADLISGHPPGTVWLAIGFGLAALLIAGRAMWPAVLVGALLLHLIGPHPVVAALGLAAMHVATTVLGAALIERWAGGMQACELPRSILRFALLTWGVVGPVGATGTVLVVQTLGLPQQAGLAELWSIVYLGHVAGVQVLTPALLLWVSGAPGRPQVRRVVETGLLLTAVLLAAVVLFGPVLPAWGDRPWELGAVPIVLWTAFRFGRRETAGVVAVLAGLAIWGTWHGRGPFAGEDAPMLVLAYSSALAVVGVVVAALVAESRRAEEKLQRLAGTDPLTGLANYRRLLDVLRAEIARSNRTRRPFALVFFDLVGLKAINDRDGHTVGNRALCRVATVLSRSCRVIDTPARFGGDEFAVVLPESGAEGGVRVAERVAKALAEDPARPAVAVSSGTAVYPGDGDNPTMLMRAADQALSRAKSGRRVTGSDAEESSGRPSRAAAG